LNRSKYKGIPIALTSEELSSSANEARDFMADESSRVIPTLDPATPQSYVVSNSDLAALRAKFPFLKDFIDDFIRANKPESLIKLETANVKLKEAERSKDADDRLAHNRANIGTICVDMGIDDRKTHLHDGRFLPGANCSAAKLWLVARERTPLHGGPPPSEITTWRR
jgi:hypothetical protein